MDFQNIKPTPRWDIRTLIVAVTLFVGLESSSQAQSESQSLSLGQCYRAAQELSPLAAQNQYYQSMATLREKMANTGNYPQIDLNGQLSYQSDVFVLPFEDPTMETPEIPRDQYRLSAGLNQKIFDGGSVKRTRALIEAEAAVNQQQVAVDLYQIRTIINNLFFGALVNQENAAIMEAQLTTLREQLSEVESKVKNGVLLASNADIIKKEILSAEQRLIVFSIDTRAFKDMLEDWTGEEISDARSLLAPDLSAFDKSTLEINRPELHLFNLQNQHLEAQQQLTVIKNYPRLSAFFNGGVASPNPFNLFETDLSGYYLTGVTLKWKVFDWNRNKNDIKTLDFQRKVISSHRADFEHRVSIDLVQSDAEIRKLEELLKRDQEILELQQRIVEASYAQLQNGVITSTNYITELNKETLDKLALNLRTLSLLRTKIDKLTKSGNYETDI
ncbi:MAG: TolC family protein [Cyclobacteriaceae bacterium]|nr:TolC family protein [Cyclobacteriaceae bacterium]